MGGDAAPGEVVAGAVAAARELDVSIRLVGPSAAECLEAVPQPTGPDDQLCHGGVVGNGNALQGQAVGCCMVEASLHGDGGAVASLPRQGPLPRAVIAIGIGQHIGLKAEPLQQFGSAPRDLFCRDGIVAGG